MAKASGKSAAAGARTSKKAEAEQPKLKIQWYRSTIGANSRQKTVVRSLGFTRLNQVVERPDTPSMRGAVQKVPHLLRIVE